MLVPSFIKIDSNQIVKTNVDLYVREVRKKRNNMFK
jgi:hypothetical protein